jgi:hypothetical protein
VPVIDLTPYVDADERTLPEVLAAPPGQAVLDARRAFLDGVEQARIYRAAALRAGLPVRSVIWMITPRTRPSAVRCRSRPRRSRARRFVRVGRRARAPGRSGRQDADPADLDPEPAGAVA